MTLTLESIAEKAIARAERAEQRLHEMLAEMQRAEKPIHIYVHKEEAPSVRRVLAEILTRLGAIEMASAENLARVKRIDDGLTNIAEDIRRIKEQVDDKELSDALEAIAKRTEGLAAENPEPVPPVTP